MAYFRLLASACTHPTHTGVGGTHRVRVQSIESALHPLVPVFGTCEGASSCRVGIEVALLQSWKGPLKASEEGIFNRKTLFNVPLHEDNGEEDDHKCEDCEKLPEGGTGLLSQGTAGWIEILSFSETGSMQGTQANCRILFARILHH